MCICVAYLYLRVYVALKKPAAALPPPPEPEKEGTEDEDPQEEESVIEVPPVHLDRLPLARRRRVGKMRIQRRRRLCFWRGKIP